MKCCRIAEDFNVKNPKVGVIYIEFSHEESEHIHEGIEVVYIIGGRGTHVINDKKIKAKRGTLIILNKESVHSFYNIEPMKYYNVMFDPSFLNSSLTKDDTISELFKVYGAETDQECIAINLEDEKIAEMEKVFFDMFMEGSQKNIGYLNIIQSKLQEVIITIIRNNVLKEEEITKNIVFEEAVDYITEHCCENLRLEEVAEMFGYESTYFSRILKRDFGFGFKQLVVRKKLDKAMREIWGGEDTIEEIIQKYGFTNKTYFYTTFEKIYGEKPKLIMDYGKLIRDNNKK